MKEETLAVLRGFQVEETTGYLIYSKLAAKTPEPNRSILQAMAEDERRHANIWAGYTKQQVKAQHWRVWLYMFLHKIFGLTFVINLLERGEDQGAEQYRTLLEEVPEALQIIEDETRHERELVGMLDEEKLKYIGSMVLGLNDALVELTGALAGFTLALGSNTAVGLAGFITGVAATLSMAASEYLSKKADPDERHPLKAAVYTGVAYLIVVMLLLLPYAITSTPLLALGLCLFNAACVILVFTWFVSIVRREAFAPKFFEMLAISFGVALVSFFIGWAARAWLGLEI